MPPLRKGVVLLQAGEEDQRRSRTEGEIRQSVGPGARSNAVALPNRKASQLSLPDAANPLTGLIGPAGGAPAGEEPRGLLLAAGQRQAARYFENLLA
jgi:hypothetical protein